MESILYEVDRDYSNTISYNIGKNKSLLHFHQQIEILHIDKGEYEITINEQTLNVKEGAIIVADSFDNHKFTPLSDDALSSVLILPNQYLKQYFSMMKDKILIDHFILDNERQEKIYKAMLNVHDTIDKNELILEGYISILLGTIIDNNICDNKDKANYDLIKKILIYIEDNYQSQITLQSIANYFGYSKYYFSHLFNKCFNCNLNDYINLVRCRHTVNFVLNEHLSSADAAYKAGFVSLRTFYRTFQKFFKITPKEYFSGSKKVTNQTITYN